MTARSPIGLAAVALLVGCSRGAATVGTETPTPSRPDETVVASEELRSAADAPNLYEAVKRLRPRWLAQDVVVYVSNRRYGGSEALRQLLPSTVASLRYFSPSAAQQRFGSNHPNGAIQVIMRGAR